MAENQARKLQTSGRGPKRLVHRVHDKSVEKPGPTKNNAKCYHCGATALNDCSMKQLAECVVKLAT